MLQQIPTDGSLYERTRACTVLFGLFSKQSVQKPLPRPVVQTQYRECGPLESDLECDSRRIDCLYIDGHQPGYTTQYSLYT